MKKVLGVLLNVMKKVFGILAFILGFDCEIRRQCVDDGICDFSGQGRDKYGR